MAFVDDHQVKEVLGVVLQCPEPVLVRGESLVQREVDLATQVRLAPHAPDGLSEHRPKFAVDRLLDQDLTVGEVQDARATAGGPQLLRQLPDDLHRHEGSCQFRSPSSQGHVCPRLPGPQRVG